MDLQEEEGVCTCPSLCDQCPPLWQDHFVGSTVGVSRSVTVWLSMTLCSLVLAQMLLLLLYLALLDLSFFLEVALHLSHLHQFS